MSPSAPAGDTPLYRCYVYPFVLFISFTLLLSLVSGMQWEHPAAPWWQQAPEMWLYPLQTVICAGYLWYVRRGIAWDWAWRPCLLGVLLGAIGIAFWLVPYVMQWVPQEGGFRPAEVFEGNSAAIAAQYTLRFARAVLVVPLVEELFWRGFLMRWCVDRDFPQTVPLGTPGLLPYLVTTVCFMAVHLPQDYAGAFIFGSLAYWLMVKTRCLMAVVAMHAVANLIMGLCAVFADMPQLW